MALNLMRTLAFIRHQESGELAMKTRIAVTALIVLVIHGTMLGIGALLIFGTTMRSDMPALLPIAASSFILAVPMAWITAGWMVQRYGRRRLTW